MQRPTGRTILTAPSTGTNHQRRNPFTRHRSVAPVAERQQAKLTRCLEAGDPDGEVNVAWQCYQQLRSIYHSSADQGRRTAAKVIASFPTCPIPEVARFGRTLKAWRQQVLAYFDTSGVSNGGTEAIRECCGGWSGTS